ncbi:leucine-zipper-like transcriptional regulator 1 homolog isoform X1 [Bufo bufo]|uniref:leucine-zipper-like transcriptional regulator 1 homolog isoform X1 n=2 Tax=Bufo bufo TaxID=8384 RepID=UPI001ABDAF0A|nr:leucine-zipper-like transcriptional regulator 1 homolog isoform X1 [Bufo bufo]XP_040295999.1 leucine-zipper-like transcriptional regulator 1 homolog isoform X1 [Bufo bufo]
MPQKPPSMITESADCAWEPLSRREEVPCDRFKHAAVAYDGYVYIHGGRQDSVLGDFWRYSIALSRWEQLPSCRRAPDKLEGHSMVAHEGVLYVFGGMVDFGANRDNTPLWMYATDTRRWCEFKAQEGQENRPTNRKGHSAVVNQSAMFVYGGYFDIEGAVEEFWVYYFDTQKWSQLCPHTRGMGPGPRHGHSCVTHNAAMFLFGGLKNMAEQNDFWRFDFRRHNWSVIKTSFGPPKLVGHGSVIHQGCLWIVGGGLPSRTPAHNLWRYHFASCSWKKFSRVKQRVDCARVYHCVVAVGGRSTSGGRSSSLCSEHPEALGGDSSAEKLYSFLTLGSNKVSTLSACNLIEMKTFNERPAPTALCSCSFSTGADEQRLLTGYENESFTLLEEGYPQTAPSCGDPAEEEFFLMIGGKPLSRHCEISIGRVMMK